jgi:hypothetical protein
MATRRAVAAYPTGRILRQNHASTLEAVDGEVILSHDVNDDDQIRFIVQRCNEPRRGRDK